MWDKVEQIAARFIIWRISKHSVCETKDIEDDDWFKTVAPADLVDGYGRCPVCLLHDTARVLGYYYLTK